MTQKTATAEEIAEYKRQQENRHRHYARATARVDRWRDLMDFRAKFPKGTVFKESWHSPTLWERVRDGS